MDARERLLRAAEKLFAEKGYAATRVQEITDAAGVNKALLYYYFEDKHAIYVALIEDGIEQFKQMLESALSTPGSYAERLRELVHRHLERLWERPDLLRVVQRSHMAGEVEDVDLAAAFKEPLECLERFFAEASASGEFADVDPHMAALSMLALNNGFATYQSKSRLETDPATAAEHISRVLLRGFQR